MEELVCPGTVTAVTEGLLHAVAKHACVSGDRVHGHYDDARRWLGHLAWFGVDLDALTADLEEAPRRTARQARVPAPLAASHAGTAQAGARPAAGVAA